MNLLLVSAIVGVSTAVIAWEIRLFVRVRKRDRKALQFMQDADKTLAPVLKQIEAGLFEVSGCITIGMTTVANAIVPPLDWLLGSNGADVGSPRS